MFLLFFFFLKLPIYFWLSWVFFAVRGFSLVAVSRGYFLVAVHRLQVHGLQGLWPTGLAALHHVGSPRTRIEPVFPELQSGLNHWTTMEALSFSMKIQQNEGPQSISMN